MTTETKQELLYDCKRDGKLAIGEAIVTYQDGTTEHLKKASLIESALPEVEIGKEAFSEGGMIYYLDGYAWGINGELVTIGMGTEAAIRVAIDNPKLKCGDPVIDGIIQLEREAIKKEGEQYGKRPKGTIKLRAQKSNRPSNKRVRPLSNTRRFRDNIRRPAPAQKPTRCDVKPQQPMLFGGGSA